MSCFLFDVFLEGALKFPCQFCAENHLSALITWLIEERYLLFICCRTFCLVGLLYSSIFGCIGYRCSIFCLVQLPFSPPPRSWGRRVRKLGWFNSCVEWLLLRHCNVIPSISGRVGHPRPLIILFFRWSELFQLTKLPNCDLQLCLNSTFLVYHVGQWWVLTLLLGISYLYFTFRVWVLAVLWKFLSLASFTCHSLLATWASLSVVCNS